MDKEVLKRRRYKDVTIEVDGERFDFRIRSLTQREYQALAAPLIDEDGRINPEEQARFTARLIQLCVVNDRGELLFSEADWPEIENWDCAVATKLSAACQEHIGLGGAGKNSQSVKTG